MSRHVIALDSKGAKIRPVQSRLYESRDSTSKNKGHVQKKERDQREFSVNLKST